MPSDNRPSRKPQRVEGCSPEVEHLFAEYCAAARKAQATQMLADGVAAGQAWAAFLNAFTGVPARTEALHA